MPSKEERVAKLQEANERRQEAKRAAVEEALQLMLRHQQRVSVAGVAKAAGVSRNFIYQHLDLLKRVTEAAAGASHRMAQPRAKSSSEDSLRNRLADALDAVREAKEENKRLREKVERLTGELARQIASQPGQRRTG